MHYASIHVMSSPHLHTHIQSRDCLLLTAGTCLKTHAQKLQCFTALGSVHTSMPSVHWSYVVMATYLNCSPPLSLAHTQIRNLANCTSALCLPWFWHITEHCEVWKLSRPNHAYMYICNTELSLWQLLAAFMLLNYTHWVHVSSSLFCCVNLLSTAFFMVDGTSNHTIKWSRYDIRY